MAFKALLSIVSIVAAIQGATGTYRLHRTLDFLDAHAHDRT